MKNRKTVVVAFLLVAAMLLGVGYAALSDTLYVNGTFNLSAEDADNSFEKEIFFTDERVVDSGTGDTADTIDIGVDDDGDTDDEIIFTVDSLAIVGEKAVFEYRIQNDNDFPVTATPDTTFNNTCFNVTGIKEVEIGGNSFVTVTVTVELIAIPTDGSAVENVAYALTYTVVPTA